MAVNTRVQFSATLTDELGTKASTVTDIYGDDGQTVVNIHAAAVAWATALDSASSAQITRLEACVILPTGSFKQAPLAGSRVEQTAVVNLMAGNTGRKWGIAIPSVRDALIVANKLDLGNAAVTTLVALLQGAALGGLYTTPYGNALGTVVDAILSFRKRTALRRSSFEGGNPNVVGGG